VLVDFFLHLQRARLPVSTREFLTLLEALREHVADQSIDDFHLLARTCLIKDEAHYDRYDLAFGSYFQGAAALFDVKASIPEEWLRGEFMRLLSEADRAKIEALGGLDKLLETFKQRLAEQRERHAGGNKWIGTGGTSPFGSAGFNPEGIRIGQQGGGQRRAVKVWDQRSFRNLDGSVELNTRNIKVALRRLRRFAREGPAEELDLDGTITGTARNAGWLDLHLVPERRNRAKVLLLLDVGGSMDPHVQLCEELFSAARTEFRHLETFYFHNCVYEHVWRDNRRHNQSMGTLELLRTYGPDWKLIVVGDAAMSPYELLQPGGGASHFNEESGLAWLKRLSDHFRKLIWWNPEKVELWEHMQSTQLILQLLGPRMFPLTLEGISRGIDALRH